MVVVVGLVLCRRRCPCPHSVGAGRLVVADIAGQRVAPVAIPFASRFAGPGGADVLCAVAVARQVSELYPARKRFVVAGSGGVLCRSGRRPLGGSCPLSFGRRVCRASRGGSCFQDLPRGGTTGQAGTGWTHALPDASPVGTPLPKPRHGGAGRLLVCGDGAPGPAGGDSVRWAEALLRRGAYALSLGDSAYPRAERLIGEGYELARRLHSVQLFRLAYLHSVALYIRLRQPEKALIMAKKTMEGVQGNSLAMARASLLVGGTYYQMGHYDSASVYLQRVLGDGDDLLKDSACGLLALISEKEGNWEQALRWKKEQEEVRRQWHALRQEVEMAVAAREVEWSEAERMQAKSRLPMAFYFLLLVGLWICFWEAKAFLCRKSRAGEVDVEAIDAPVEKQETWDYALFKMKMHETDVYASLSGILEHYAQYANYSRHWDGELERAFVREADVLLPGYRMALMEEYPCLDAQDVCLCLFYMLDFTDAQIGVIWELNKSSVIRRRQRILCRKMNSKKTAKEDLLKICMLSPEVQEMHPSQ